jgi:hypothetical protein
MSLTKNQRLKKYLKIMFEKHAPRTKKKNIFSFDKNKHSKCNLMKNGLNLTTWAKLSNPKAHQAHKYNTKSKKKK